MPSTIKAIPKLTDNDIYRFWSKVTLLASPLKCWLWAAASKQKGYGKISFSPIKGESVVIAAHRIAYFLHYGKDPVGMVILHKCDNILCVNPHHLEEGTQKDNMQDMFKKHRHNLPKGSQHFKAKIKEQAVREIREKHTTGTTKKKLAAEYNIDLSQINRIVNFAAWKHVS
jgi:hypothetical protein